MKTGFFVLLEVGRPDMLMKGSEVSRRRCGIAKEVPELAYIFPSVPSIYMRVR